MEYLIVDRIEENFIVCENETNGEMININKDLVKFEVKQGDYLYYENGDYKLDINKTNLAHEEIKNMINKLFRK